MVVSVYGKCNGQDLIFNKVKEVGLKSTWTITVPKVPSGQYVIELYAVDDAGNKAYFATVKLTYDSSQMAYQWIILEVGANWTLDDVGRVLGNNYSSR